MASLFESARVNHAQTSETTFFKLGSAFLVAEKVDPPFGSTSVGHENVGAFFGRVDPLFQVLRI